MPIIDPEPRLEVAVGVIQNESDQLLIQQRLPGKACAGQWEFPGGKVEDSETPDQALIRELEEELGIQVIEIFPLKRIAYDYPHAKVLLNVFRVTQFGLKPTGKEGQDMAWCSIPEIRKLDVLAAVHPILEAMKAFTTFEPSRIAHTSIGKSNVDPGD